jgi:peptide/nickel transport system ATP-binding protein
MSGPVLEVDNLEKHYPITQGVLRRQIGTVRAVDGISFQIEPGETVGLVGESGCGKSTAATSILQLEEPTGGDVRFNGESLLDQTDAERKAFRRNAQMVFQDPESTFDPRMSVGESIAEPLRIHGVSDREKRRAVAMNLLDRVGMERSDIDRYPHEFSGGQKQRIALARALVVNPEFIVADEPVSALDVSIQAKVIELINDIKSEFGLSLLFISHDMGVIREVCDRVAVMSLGEIVEMAPTEQLFEDPQHPYTQALIAAIPNSDPRKRGTGTQLTGDVPSPQNPPDGCRFHTRCPSVIQPEGYEFEQSAWRSVMDYRLRLQREGVDPEGIREFVANEEDIEESAVAEDAMRDAVREEFGIPEELSDANAEETFVESLGYVFDGEHDRAAALLREEFETVCETDAPETVELAGNRRAACHLHAGIGESEIIDAEVADATGD